MKKLTSIYYKIEELKDDLEYIIDDIQEKIDNINDRADEKGRDLTDREEERICELEELIESIESYRDDLDTAQYNMMNYIDD